MSCVTKYLTENYDKFLQLANKYGAMNWASTQCASYKLAGSV